MGEKETDYAQNIKVVGRAGPARITPRLYRWPAQVLNWPGGSRLINDPVIFKLSARMLHTCQCEKMPFEMAKAPVQPRSAPKRHSAMEAAVTEAGGSKAAIRRDASCEITAARLTTGCNLSATAVVVPATTIAVLDQAGCRNPPNRSSNIAQFHPLLSQ
jgi:hypothetical protein